MNEQLGFSYAILNDSYAVGNGTLCIGAFLLIPFALKYGRRPIYIISTAAQLAVSIWSAKLETVADIMLINAFSCGVGALAEVIVQMTVADMFFVHERGKMNSFYVWAQNIGGSLAPVAAGYITVSQGWRWVWWWCAIFFGVALVSYVFLYEETKFDHSAIEGVGIHASQDPVGEFSQTASDEETNIEKKSDLSEAKLEPRASKGSTAPEVYRSRLLSVIDVDSSIPRKSYVQRLTFWSSSPGPLSHFFRHSYQPFFVLFTIPGVFFVSLTYGALIAMSTVQVTTLSSWMAEPPYNFDAAQIGLMSLPSWIGSTLGALIVGPLSDWLIVFLARRNHGIYEPEMRLWVIVAFIPFVPAGLFMFGFGLNNGSSWPIVAIGYGLASFGTLPASSLSLTYLTDAYTEVRSSPGQYFLKGFHANGSNLPDHWRRARGRYIYTQSSLHNIRLRPDPMDREHGDQECLYHHRHSCHSSLAGHFHLHLIRKEIPGEVRRPVPLLRRSAVSAKAGIGQGRHRLATISHSLCCSRALKNKPMVRDGANERVSICIYRIFILPTAWYEEYVEINTKPSQGGFEAVGHDGLELGL